MDRSCLRVIGCIEAGQSGDDSRAWLQPGAIEQPPLVEARALADYSRNFPVKVNLIEYNEVEGTGYLKSPPEQVEAFKDLLESRNMIVNLRQSRGEDIDAACGQLAGKKGNQTDSPNH